MREILPANAPHAGADARIMRHCHLPSLPLATHYFIWYIIDADRRFGTFAIIGDVLFSISPQPEINEIEDPQLTDIIFSYFLWVHQ